MNYHGELWWSKWQAAELIGSAYVAYLISRRYGILAGLCFYWPVMNAILIYDGQIPMNNQNANRILSIENIIMRATLCWILTIVPIAWLKLKDQISLTNALGFLCIADSLYVIYQAMIGIPYDSRLGIVGTNASLNGCLIAITVPFYMNFFIGSLADYVLGWALFLVPIVAVLLEGASIPVGALVVVFISLGAPSKNWFGLFPGALLLGVGAMFTPYFLSDSGRFNIWKASIHWWWTNANHWVGTGNGTFFTIGPMVQFINHIDPHVLFIWTHNDWLQTLIEQGYIGAILFLGLFGQCLYRAYRNKMHSEFAAAMGYGAISVFNFPAHSILTALVGAIVAARCLDTSQENNNETTSRNGPDIQSASEGR